MSADAVLPPFDRATNMRKQLDVLEAQLGQPGSVLVPVWREQSLIAGGRAALVPVGRARELLQADHELVFLGALGGQACFAVDVSALPDPLAQPALSGSGEFKDLRQCGSALGHDEVALLAYARAMLYWHARQRHCGVCGAPTAPREGGHVRLCRREECGVQHFPRTDPAIIVLVHDGDDCLLGRQRRWPAGMYSTLAGFVEAGETLEQAVVREVAEESGIRVDEVRYVRSQPWPFPSSLMIGFAARARSREIDLQDDELEDARWFSREQIQNARDHGFFVPGVFSLAGQLIEAFLNGAPA